MDKGDRRAESFLDHLGESEERLGARRNSVFDALVIGLIAVIILGGLTLGFMRLRTPIRVDRLDTAAPTSAPVSASPATPATGDETLKTQKRSR